MVGISRRLLHVHPSSLVPPLLPCHPCHPAPLEASGTCGGITAPLPLDRLMLRQCLWEGLITRAANNQPAPNLTTNNQLVTLRPNHQQLTLQNPVTLESLKNTNFLEVQSYIIKNQWYKSNKFTEQCPKCLIYNLQSCQLEAIDGKPKLEANLRCQII